MCLSCHFIVNVTAASATYTLSLHDALPICRCSYRARVWLVMAASFARSIAIPTAVRSEEHTSELQSRGHLVCRLLLEKKKLPSIELRIEFGGQMLLYFDANGLRQRMQSRSF